MEQSKWCSPQPTRSLGEEVDLRSCQLEASPSLILVPGHPLLPSTGVTAVVIVNVELPYVLCVPHASSFVVLSGKHICSSSICRCRRRQVHTFSGEANLGLHARFESVYFITIDPTLFVCSYNIQAAVPCVIFIGLALSVRISALFVPTLPVLSNSPPVS